MHWHCSAAGKQRVQYKHGFRKEMRRLVHAGRQGCHFMYATQLTENNRFLTHFEATCRLSLVRLNGVWCVRHHSYLFGVMDQLLI